MVPATQHADPEPISFGPFSRIVVAVAPSPASERAVRLAILLARGRRDVELVFCHAIDVHRMLVQADRTFDDFGVALAGAREAAQAVLERSCDLARAAGVDSRSYVCEGKPAVEVAALADALGADLIVVGNSPADKVRRLLCGSVRDAVVRASHLPVLVADMDPARPVDFQPRCIVVLRDDSPASFRAARLASEIARAYAARLVSVPAAAVESAVLEHQPDVVVAGMARRPAWHGIFRTTSAERLLHDPAVPLLAVNDGPAEGPLAG